MMFEYTLLGMAIWFAFWWGVLLRVIVKAQEEEDFF